jgi:hypothetical protein
VTADGDITIVAGGKRALCPDETEYRERVQLLLRFVSRDRSAMRNGEDS